MSITISGSLSRQDATTTPGTPRKSQILSFIAGYAITPFSTVCTGGGGICASSPTVVTNETYSVYQCTTDCSGNYTITIPGSPNYVEAHVGDLISNSAWSICNGYCLGMPEFIPNPADPLQSNSINIDCHAGGGSSSSSSPDDGWNTGGPEPINWHGINNIMTGNYSPIATSAITLNLQQGGAGVNANGAGIQVLVKKGTQYYQVTNFSITLTDTCGGSNTFTAADSFFGGPTWTDWMLWNSMTINAGIPPNCNYSTNPNLTAVSLAGYDYMTVGNALPSVVGVVPSFSNFRWFILLQDCTNVGTPALIADHYHNVINVAWINSSGDTYISSHRHPSKQIGSSTTGWDTPIKLNGSAANMTNLGMTYLLDGVLKVITYNTSDIGVFTSNAFGAAGSFSGSMIAGTGVEAYMPGQHTRGQTSVLMMAASHAGLTADTTKTGTFAPSPTNITAVPDEVRGNVIDTGSKFGILATVAGVTRWYTMTNIGGSLSSATVSTITHTVVSVVLCRSHTIAALVMNTATGQYYAARSRNNGTTWEQDSTAISVIPTTLTSPPMLVSLNNGLYAVWVVAQQPWFAFSPDEGRTWT